MSELKAHAQTAEAVAAALKTDIGRGLTDAEVQARLAQYGPNELKREDAVSPWTVFFNQFKNVLIIILLGATVLSALVGEIFDAGLIFVIVIFCALLGFVQEYRAEKALEALKKMLSPMITALRNGLEIEVLSKDLVPGDVLILEAGDKVPADARLVQAASFKTDEASLTGESLPVSKQIGPLSENVRLGDCRNMVFTGTAVTYGRGKAVVTATGEKTEFGKIAAGLSSVKAEKTPLEKRTAEIGKWLGFTALAICVLILSVSMARQYLSGEPITLPFTVKLVMFAIALAVAAVPEALAAIVTGALAIGMHQMAKRNALIRKMPAVETLGCTTVICTDKTGTLTKNEMTVRQLYVSGRVVEVTGAGYAPQGDFKCADQAALDQDSTLGQFLTAMTLCNDASLAQTGEAWTIKGDPTEGALIVTAAKKGLDANALKAAAPRVEEFPFSSERKRMTTIHQLADRRLACTKGAGEVVLGRCDRVMENGVVVPLDAVRIAAIQKTAEGMAQNALRVLGVASRDLPAGDLPGEDAVESGMVFLGLVGMIDPPRPEVIAAIQTCRQVKIKPVMITGDHQLTAVAIAKEIGIFQEGDRVLNGDQLEHMTEDDLVPIVRQVSVYARVSPLDKLKIVRAWKKLGEVVAMTGDGVNDAPALKQADIGIAMGITGTEVAKEAADMVLNDDNFATIVSAIERGRWIYDNIKKYLTYLLRCNIIEVVVIGGVVLVGGIDYLPLLPAAILYINLATDGLPALALGVAPPDPDIMRRPPRNPREGVFSFDVKLFILVTVLLEIPFFFFLYFHDLKDPAHARTEIFFLFIVVEMIIALNFRSMRYSVFKVPPHKWIWLAIGWEAVLIVVLMQFESVRESFGIIMPTVRDLSIIGAFGVVVFIVMELVKRYLHRRALRLGETS